MRVGRQHKATALVALLCLLATTVRRVGDTAFLQAPKENDGRLGFSQPQQHRTNEFRQAPKENYGRLGFSQPQQHRTGEFRVSRATNGNVAYPQQVRVMQTPAQQAYLMLAVLSAVMSLWAGTGMNGPASWTCENAVIFGGLVADNLAQAGLGDQRLTKLSMLLHCLTSLLIPELVSIAQTAGELTSVEAVGGALLIVVAPCLTLIGMKHVCHKDAHQIKKSLDSLRRKAYKICLDPMKAFMSLSQTKLIMLLPAQMTVGVAILAGVHVEQATGDPALLLTSSLTGLGFTLCPYLLAKVAQAHGDNDPTTFVTAVGVWQNCLELLFLWGICNASATV